MMHPVFHKLPRRLLTARGLACTVPLLVLFALETAAVKGLQVTALEGGFRLVPFLASWAPDLALTGLFAALFSIGFSLGRHFVLQAVGSLLFYPLVTYALVITAASHAYFAATGANLSWGPIDYWLDHPVVTTQIMNTAAGFGPFLALAAVFVVLMGCAIILPRIGPLARRLERAGPVATKKAAWALGIVVLLTIALALVPRSEAKSAIAAQSIPVSIVGSLLQDFRDDDANVVIAQDERVGRELVYRAEPGFARPNIVLFIFESLAWHATDIYQPGLDTTPFLAELAPRGALVRHHYTIVPHTTKALVPIICGINPYLKSKARESEPGNLPPRCLPHILSEHGYRTAFFQPARNFEDRDQLVMNMGYGLYKGNKDLPVEGFQRVNYLGHEGRIMVQPAFDWVDEVRDEPFFLTYLTLATHHNYVVPHTFETIDFDTPNREQAAFFNALRYIDALLRDVVEGFEDRGLLEDTVFVIVGDHGEAFHEHGRAYHDLVLWEEGARSAMLLFGPSYIDPGQQIHGIRSHLDILPTVTELLGLRLIEGRHLGYSLFKPVPEDRELYYSCWFNNQCLAKRTGWRKTLYHYDLKPMEVYDNESDPGELNDLAHQGPYDQAFLERQRDEMLAWRKKINKQYALWNREKVRASIHKVEPRVQHRREAVLGDYLEFVGFDASHDQARAGQNVKLRLAFKSLKAIPKGIELELTIRQGKRRTARIVDPVLGQHPLHKWKPGQYVVDEQWLHIPGKSGDSIWSPELALIDGDTKKPLPIQAPAKWIVDGRLELTRIPVKSAKKRAKLTPDQRREQVAIWRHRQRPAGFEPIDVVFGDTVALAGVAYPRPEARPLETLVLDYLFQVKKKIPRGWRVAVRLKREDKAVAADHAPLGGMFPTDLWLAGEYVVDRHQIYVSRRKLKGPGVYSVWVGLKDRSRFVQPTAGEGEFDADGLVRVGEVTVLPKAEKE
jgi:arylsulfatase A-like enzyme